MRVKDAIAARKKVLDWGNWREGGKVPRSAFYLVKSNQFSFGKAYKWRVLRAEALGLFFRVLIAYDPRKEQYYAYLGMESGADIKLLISYEFHGTHPGWHVHSACGDIAEVPIGRQKGPWSHRIPKPNRERKTNFRISNEPMALYAACRAFRLLEENELQLQ
jgi:hypothetical protein